MILKFIIFTIVALIIYKFVGGRFPELGSIRKKRTEKKQIEEDTLVECAKCSTFVTYKESIIVGGKAYCSKECAGF